MDHIEAKREEARKHKGVWYDVRADKFVAEVYSKGDRHFLGHFATADEAADAYAKARAELPTGRGGDDSFVQVFQSFLDECAKDTNGRPKVGEFMTYKEQDFSFEGIVFRVMKGRKRPFFEWVSACSVCHAPYDTLTATTPGVAKGITRNCETHRKGAKPSAQPKAEPAPPVPQEWIDTANAALDALSLVSDSFDFAVFLPECLAITPGLPRAFSRFVLEHPKSPVISKDGILFPRNTQETAN